MFNSTDSERTRVGQVINVNSYYCVTPAFVFDMSRLQVFQGRKSLNKHWDKSAPHVELC